jgi:hypothetical protein
MCLQYPYQSGIKVQTVGRLLQAGYNTEGRQRAIFKSNEKSTVKILPSTNLISLVNGFIMENVIANIHVNVKILYQNDGQN